MLLDVGEPGSDVYAGGEGLVGGVCGGMGDRLSKDLSSVTS